MTARETERLAKVEQKLDSFTEEVRGEFRDIKDTNLRDLAEIKALLRSQDNRLSSFIDASENKFVSNAQAKVASWIIGTVIAVVSIIALFWSKK